ncbi:hypothetical protein A7J57_21970 [Agrobacterium tumefaciens]|uniref:Uncharacterized protein n=1 Tax=Agrobacterium tumefaciens TaxID=358 RepID=A0A176XHM1_AGRTU|nr:hypothetical protein A7J57_21970 [Agrobacterium tumefaciens]
MSPERPAKPISNVVAFKGSHQREQGLDKDRCGHLANAAAGARPQEAKASFWLRLFLSFSAACCLVSVMPISGGQPEQGNHPD